MSKTDQISEQDLGQRQEYSEDGVDLSLIRWMLDLTPTQRLDVLEQAANLNVPIRDVRQLRLIW